MSSWFFLTLWKGAPPEFCTSFDANVDTREMLGSKVEVSDSTDSMLCVGSHVYAKITEEHNASANVQTRTGVAWHV